jgi:hypothetical protein
MIRAGLYEYVCGKHDEIYIGKRYTTFSQQQLRMFEGKYKEFCKLRDDFISQMEEEE